MADVAMPRLSDSMEEGTILKWLKSDGDEVQKGEELVEIETDKANMTYESDEAGTLEIVAQEGDTVAVGEPICRLGEGGGRGGDSEEDEEPEAEADSDDEDAAAEPEAGEDAESDRDESGGEEEDAGGDEDKSGDEDQEGDAEQEPEREAEPVATAEEGDAEEDGGADERAEGEEEDEEAGEREGVGPDEDEGGDQDGHRDEAPESAPAEAASSDGGNGRVKASPVARRMAQELGVELDSLKGTGPGGRIVKADVEAAAGDGDGAQAEPAEAEQPAKEQQPAAEAKKEEPKRDDVPPPVVSGDAGTGRGETRTEDLTRLQQTVARRMAESKATAPEFVMTCEVDMEEAVAFRGQLKAAAGEDPAPSFNDFVVKASALALREFPRANGAYRDGKFELYSRVNVGIAVAGQDALIVPTVFDADRKSLGEIARDARTVAERVRAGAITPPELSSGTFTVSNLGMFGIARFVAVINPPQAAILAVGEMQPRPVVRDGEIVVRPIMELTLACDHRILYGADAAKFLGRIRERLENPLSLAL
jgi:pyruvate dehydrogenase E2 component (dihydrolipoamide acetyltransferase)